MAQTETTDQDTLSHIEYQDRIDADDPALLRNQVSSTNGQIVIVAAYGCSLVLNYSFGPGDLNVNVTLQTPVGNVTLINTDLNPNNPSITLGGSINSFKAEATVSFDFGSMQLTASGQICAPILGCKSGSVTIHV